MNTSEDNPADWFLFGAERLQAADLIHRTEGATWTGIELLQEATERYLKGWLIDRGWKLERTHDLRTRMDLHNRGRVVSTAERRPLRLIYYEACIDEQDGFRREKYLKTTYGKRYIKTRCRNYFTG